MNCLSTDSLLVLYSTAATADGQRLDRRGFSYILRCAGVCDGAEQLEQCVRLAFDASLPRGRDTLAFEDFVKALGVVGNWKFQVDASEGDAGTGRRVVRGCGCC
jgi:hypothetical protein